MISALGIGAVACGSAGDGAGDDTTPAPGTISAAEASDLVWVREEEKLARDVYRVLDDAWGTTPVFANIAVAEQRHMDEIAVLLDAYGVADPVVDDTVGAFTDPAIAQLYAQLTTAGLPSAIDALAVGATIEDLDIFDIDARVARTDRADIVAAYGRLTCGSENHLRAFTGQLDAVGASYAPQYLTLDAYQAILAADHQMCGSP
ncbi:MAG: DUF2202 domain-containing protein [Kofleriaceae bacterium]|nr:DUF2202 domain-containing protein [Kofleriaceae bacterium]